MFVTEVRLVMAPRGRPVWKTSVMLTWRGDIVKKEEEEMKERKGVGEEERRRGEPNCRK